MNLKKIILFLFFILLNLNNLYADEIYYLDFNKILNESNAGKKAQDFLKKKLDNGVNDIKNKEKKLQEEEKKVIQQKKVISSDEYKKKVKELRGKVLNLQKSRNELLQNVSIQRSKARDELIKNLNPILKNFMQEKNIRLVIDKKNVLLGDEKLEITNDILTLLNKKLKSINLN